MYPKRDDPQDLLIEAMVVPESMIERSEKRGQTALVDSDVLPRKFNIGSREELEQMGVVFGENADDLFVYVTLPDGWKREATDHSMWSKLFDDQGRERVSIFYKAAFYDRDAHNSIVKRFNASSMPIDGWDDPEHRSKEWVGVVKDGEEIIMRTLPLEPEPADIKENRDEWTQWQRKKDALVDQAVDWLNDRFPDWKNRLAYWD